MGSGFQQTLGFFLYLISLCSWDCLLRTSKAGGSPASHLSPDHMQHANACSPALVTADMDGSRQGWKRVNCCGCQAKIMWEWECHGAFSGLLLTLLVSLLFFSFAVQSFYSRVPSISLKAFHLSATLPGLAVLGGRVAFTGGKAGRMVELEAAGGRGRRKKTEPHPTERSIVCHSPALEAPATLFLRLSVQGSSS